MGKRSGGPPAIAVKEFASSSSDRTYEVRISRVDGLIYCQCKGWQMRKHCRHLDAITKEDVLNALRYACEVGVLGI